MVSLMSKFIGIDLAWQSEKNHTGLAILKAVGRGLRLVHVSRGLRAITDILALIEANDHDETVIAVDAPLIIKNRAGQRACETEIGHRFGRADASAHTSNLTLYPDAGSVRLAAQLMQRGFVHCPAV